MTIKRQLDKRLLIGGVAVLVVLGGGGLLYAVARPEAPVPAAKASADGHAEGEAAHAAEATPPKGAEADEGVVALTAEQIQAAGITVVAVGRGGGAETRLSGRVEPMIDARAVVGASVGGRVERVLVAPGQSVRIGQPLAALVSGEAATFRAEADAAAAEAEAARLAHRRDQTLVEQGVVARQDAETSRARALSAEASARAARARAYAAGAPNASGRVSVSSPIAGVVSRVDVGPGGFVAAGGVVAEVVNPARVELVFRAPPHLGTTVRAGANLKVSGPGGDFDAVVTGVASAADGASSATVIRARTEGGVLPPAGSAVSAAVVTGGEGGGLTVPADAIQTVDGATVVFVQAPQGFRAVPVLAGRRAGGRIEILKGLEGGERIAGTNAFLLKAELAKGEAEHGH
ncbi:efflux RND transporter periplasmic adaptor subunit [Caulobacter mirabilis]|uniref:Efflux transporter periplasmic adaptor subunit n=1 Tax=Caulobacter mirabilis TaxID=69666 RepID=A0A2D2AY52_9CAUL|nr:efflux RND transporter periplasmic adaptor subunit [Caulobacter mirabilis]ATQ42915.1 efflux transporter periplasmic adaptor subunit [Caulobacter mirabilis]